MVRDGLSGELDLKNKKQSCEDMGAEHSLPKGEEQEQRYVWYHVRSGTGKAKTTEGLMGRGKEIDFI